MQFGKKGHDTGELYYPTDVAVDSDGRIWVADAYNHRLIIFQSHGQWLQTIGSKSDGAPGAGMFNVANAVTIDSQDRIWVADFYSHRIQVFDRSGKVLAVLGRPGQKAGEFDRPTDVATSGDRIYVVDYGNDRIQQFRSNL